MYYFVDSCGEVLAYKDRQSLCQDIEANDIDANVRIIDNNGFFYNAVIQNSRVVDAIKTKDAQEDREFIIEAAKVFFKDNFADYASTLKKINTLFMTNTK